MFKYSEYELQKKKHKQELVRNEFYTVGKFQIPLIRRMEVDINEISLISIVDTKQADMRNDFKTVHFFTYDWLFDKVYTRASEYIEKLKQYHALLSPDFSMFTDMPIALQIYSVFKNRWCGAYWQNAGLCVIPTVSWGDENSFEFCFDGIEEGSVVAVSTYYRENCAEEFLRGYNQMLTTIKPSAVLCYGDLFPEMKGNVKAFLPTTDEWINTLDWKDRAEFEMRKKLRNVIDC